MTITGTHDLYLVGLSILVASFASYTVDGVDDVGRREALRLQLGWVDIDHDLPVFPAVGGRERNAGDRSELLAQAIDAVVVELLLVEIVGCQAELEDRNARSIELHDDRRLDPDGHERANGIRCGDDLCD